jgi:hypothetical protein
VLIACSEQKEKTLFLVLLSVFCCVGWKCFLIKKNHWISWCLVFLLHARILISVLLSRKLCNKAVFIKNRFNVLITQT